MPQPLFHDTWAAAPIKRPLRFRKGRSPLLRPSPTRVQTRDPSASPPLPLRECHRGHPELADTCARREHALPSAARWIRVRGRRCLTNRNGGSPPEETTAPRSDITRLVGCKTQPAADLLMTSVPSAHSGVVVPGRQGQGLGINRRRELLRDAARLGCFPSSSVGGFPTGFRRRTL